MFGDRGLRQTVEVGESDDDLLLGRQTCQRRVDRGVDVPPWRARLVWLDGFDGRVTLIALGDKARRLATLPPTRSQSIDGTVATHPEYPGQELAGIAWHLADAIPHNGIGLLNDLFGLVRIAEQRLRDAQQPWGGRIDQFGEGVLIAGDEPRVQRRGRGEGDQRTLRLGRPPFPNPVVTPLAPCDRHAFSRGVPQKKRCERRFGSLDCTPALLPRPAVPLLSARCHRYLVVWSLAQRENGGVAVYPERPPPSDAHSME